MYQRILVPVDNSEYAGMAAEVAIELGRVLRCELIGMHVYNALQHERAFSRLEAGLPDRYQEETELIRQRTIHGDLIGRSLQLIAQSYVAQFLERCQGADLPATGVTTEGVNYVEICQAANSQAQLVVLGAHGLGKTRDDLLGSVCERVARGVETDLLVVRRHQALHGGLALVAIDGSGHGEAALARALDLAALLKMKIEILHCFDPFFHHTVFNKLTRVITPATASLFRVADQETLHDEIIDGGLTKVGERHLARARQVAEERAVHVETRLAIGKPRDEILAAAEQREVALLVLGRKGAHAHTQSALGSTAEQVLRAARRNVLLVSAPSATVPADPASRPAHGQAEPDQEPPAAARVALRKANNRAPDFLRHLTRSKLQGRIVRPGDEVIAYRVETTEPAGPVRITEQTKLEFL